MKLSPLFLTPLVIVFLVDLVQAAPPANDAFANAIQLSGTFDVEAGTNVDATRQAGEPATTKNSTTWYKWTAPSTGRARFSALPTGDSPIERIRMTLWLGNEIATTVFLGAVESYRNEALLIDCPVYAGTQYHICVGSNLDYDFEEGTFDCSVALQTNGDLSALNIVTASTQNSLFIQATTLSGTNATAISYGFGAPMREAGEPPRNPSYSSWWKWVAPANGYGRVSLTGSEYGNAYDYWADRSFIVYRVDSFSEMAYAEPIAISTSDWGLPADLNFPVTANLTYHIVAGGGRLTQYGFYGGDEVDMPWKVFTVQYSTAPQVPTAPQTSPGNNGEAASLNTKITKTKQAIRRAKSPSKKRALKKRLKKYLRDLRSIR